MQIFFDHIAGQAETREIVYSPATAMFEKHEYETALRNGWQIINSWGEPSFSWFDVASHQAKTFRKEDIKIE